MNQYNSKISLLVNENGEADQKGISIFRRLFKSNSRLYSDLFFKPILLIAVIARAHILSFFGLLSCLPSFYRSKESRNEFVGKF